MRTTFARIAREAAWAPAAVFLAHLVLGGIFHHEPYVDPIMHFLGGAAAAFFFRRAADIASSRVGELTGLGLDVIAFALTCTIAVFWEIGEFVSDQLFKGQSQRGLVNTMRDLIVGITGGILYLLVLRFAMALRGRVPPKARS